MFDHSKRRVIYAVSWLAYATYYLGRKSLSVSKSRIQSQLHISRDALGWIDTGYLAAYAVGQFVHGYLGDRFGSRWLVGLGMLGVALCCVVFGMGTAVVTLGAMFALNGFFQATGWPGTTKAVAQWTEPKDRGKVMGWWSTCYQVGGLVATALATWLLRHYGWRSTFWGPAILIAVVGVLSLIFLRAPEQRTTTATSTAATNDSQQERLERRAQIVEVLKSPTIWRFGMGYFCIKLIRYSLLFWLPYYLNRGLGYAETTSGMLSLAFEFGGIFGTIAFGIFSDRIQRKFRSTLSGVGLLGLALALLLYQQVATMGIVLNFAMLSVVGFLLFGPDSLLAGATAQDLAGKHATATAVSVVNGVGSFGAMLQGLVTVKVSQRWGWGALFYVFLALAFLAGLFAILPTRERVEKNT